MRINALVRIILLSVSAVLLTSLLVCGMIWDDFKLPHRSFSGTEQDYSYDNESNYSVGSASIADDIKNINIDWLGGKVEIKQGDTDKIQINETSQANNDEKLRYYVTNDTLYIKYRKSGIINPKYIAKYNKSLTIILPKATAEKINNIKVDTVSSEINISEVNVLGEIYTDGVSNDLNLSNSSARKITNETTSGDTILTDITAHEIDIDSVSGRIDIYGKIDNAEIATVSGSVTLTSVGDLNEADIASVSGAITLNIPKSNGFTAELDSISGKLHCQLPTTIIDDKMFYYSDGSAEFGFSTVSGNVNINFTD